MSTPTPTTPPQETPDLLAACWTWAGDAGPGAPGPADIDDLLARVRAAAAAGWTGLGFHDQDLRTAREAIGFDGLLAVLRGEGITEVEVEFLGDWWREDADAGAEALLLEAAAALGARTLKAGVPSREELDDLGHLVVASRLERLGDRAERAGTRGVLEAMGVPGALRIDEVVGLLAHADSPGCGAVVDLFQLACAGTDVELLRELDWSRVGSIEIGDARGSGEAITERCLPGDGDLDLPGFLGLVRSLGWTEPWGVEIISSELRRLPQPEGVRLVHERMRAALAAAR
jgi:sugar phosphate isomerase/epimerase